MSKRNSIVSSLIFSGLLFHSASAHSAGESGLYIGASGGVSNADISANQLDDAIRDMNFEDSNSDVDDKDAAWKIYGGYRFNRYLALEAAYVDLGESDITTRTTNPTAKVKGEVEADGISLQGIVRLPATDVFGVFVKAGAFRWDVESDYRLSQDGASVSHRSEDATGTGLTYGAGFSVEWGNGVAFRAEWEHFDDIGDDSETGESDVDFYSFGFRYLF